ncbi:MAG: SRPBCC family protein [Polyangiaceae bacterium]
MSSTDRIEKKKLLRAPRARVFRALTDAQEFGAWFRVKLEGEMVPGAHVRGQITSPGFEHLTMQMWVEALEPESRFAFRWHPYALDPNVDYSKEPTTLVEFTLFDEGGGTLLTIVESGFDAIPAARRAKAFEMNSEGWAIQSDRIERYVDAP